MGFPPGFKDEHGCILTILNIGFYMNIGVEWDENAGLKHQFWHFFNYLMKEIRSGVNMRETVRPFLVGKMMMIKVGVPYFRQAHVYIYIYIYSLYRYVHPSHTVNPTIMGI